VAVHGGNELVAALRDLERAGDRGAKAGIRAGGRELVKLTKQQIAGPPRWSRRGKGITGDAVDVHRTPVHVERSGGPGRLTGELRKNVHACKVRRDPLGWNGKVSAMGGKHPAGAQNVYAPLVEKAYPFLKPALERFEPIAPALFERAWAEQIGKVR
jgi:hypothetical protein